MIQSRKTVDAGEATDERPLTARSVIASTLLGTTPPRLPGRLLVRAGALFGLAEGTVRTALSRMVAAGELVAADGTYTLAGPLLARQARQDESRRAVVGAEPWDGTWAVAVVDGEPRPAPQRVELRTAATALRLAELREGVWLRPDNLDPGRLPAATAVVAAQCSRFVGACPESSAHPDRPDRSDRGRRPAADLGATAAARTGPVGDGVGRRTAGAADEGATPVAAGPLGLDAAATLAGRLWDLAGWSARADALRTRMDAVVAALEAGDTEALAPGFVLSASVLRLTQADPLLPHALLPADWPGAALRAEYDRYDAAYQSLLGAWFRAQT
ncbi:MAG: hypothetical protein JNK12_03175 [Acidimicrobiales bacterium]|nr:hypothetical protein [Acidimicrobiales bacterium]